MPCTAPERTPAASGEARFPSKKPERGSQFYPVVESDGGWDGGYPEGRSSTVVCPKALGVVDCHE